MTRWLAGVFDPGDRIDASRLDRALAPHASTIAAYGPLQAAYSGSARNSAGPLCLLDGLLDNQRELRLALDAPADASAEDILAAGYRHWGSGLPARMRGDFALLVWDHERGEGLLARDQLGVRGIFLHDASGGLYFASEVRHLLALLPRRPAPDPVSVAHWIAMSNRPGTGTLYAGIRRLHPGAMLLLDRKSMRERRYWTPHFSEPLSGSEPELAHEVRAGLDRAVHRRISAQGLTGVLMSGGLDSSSVAAVAATQAPGRVAAYAGVFPEYPAVDESVLIEELREALHLPGATAVVGAGGLLASVLEYVGAWDTPPVGWSEFWMLPLMRAARRAGAETVLGGTGGDELFGSRVYLLADLLRAGHPFQAIGLVRRLPGAGYRSTHGREVARMVASLAVSGALPLRLHQLASRPFSVVSRPFSGRDTPGWLRPEAARDLLAYDDPLAWKRLEGPRWWANTAHGLTHVIEEAGVLQHQRRRSASAGVEARHPLLDLDLVELCLRQPPRATFDPRRNRPVLRAAMTGLLPDSVRLRPGKAWFDSLIADCLTGPDGAAVRTLLSSPRTELAAYVDVEAMRRTLLDGGSGGAASTFRWMYQMWRLVTAECWLRSQTQTGVEQLASELQPSTPRVTLRTAD
jgi:asparagine synthase (glutamine-hydrolysing)